VQVGWSEEEKEKEKETKSKKVGARVFSESRRVVAKYWLIVFQNHHSDVKN